MQELANEEEGVMSTYESHEACPWCGKKRRGCAWVEEDGIARGMHKACFSQKIKMTRSYALYRAKQLRSKK